MDGQTWTGTDGYTTSGPGGKWGEVRMEQCDQRNPQGSVLGLICSTLLLLMTLTFSSKLNPQQTVRNFKPTTTTYNHEQTDGSNARSCGLGMDTRRRRHPEFTY